MMSSCGARSGIMPPPATTADAVSLNTRGTRSGGGGGGVLNNASNLIQSQRGWSFSKRLSMSSMLTSSSSAAEDLGVQPLSPLSNTRKNRKRKSGDCLFKEGQATDDSHQQRGPYSLLDCDDMDVRMALMYKTVDDALLPDKFHNFQRKRTHHHRKSSANKFIDKTNHFDSLPDEMILRILKWLPKSSLAQMAASCKRFGRLIEDESVWKKIDGIGRTFEPGAMDVVFQRKPVYLRLSRAVVKSPVTLLQENSANNLTHLDLSMCSIATGDLKHLMSHSVSLVKLSLEHLEVPKEVISEMTSFSATIDTLNLTMCYELDADCLSLFFSKSSKLKILNLSCIKTEWSEDELFRVISSLPKNMEQLNLAGFRSAMKDRHTNCLSISQKKLIDLDLSDCQELTGVTISNISPTLQNLQHLALSRCYSIEPASYGLLTNMKNLRYLELFSLFKDASIKMLEQSLPGIEINKFPFSAIARPTVGNKRSSIWSVRVRD